MKTMTQPSRLSLSRPALLFLLVFLSPLALHAEQAEQMVGQLTQLKGSVEIMKRNGKTWLTATEGMKIAAGDQVAAGIDGHAVLVLIESQTEIQPLTQFVVGRCVQSGKENYSELFLQVGKVVAQIPKKPAQPHKFNVITPTTVAGVRGTRMAISHFPSVGTQVKITEGRALVSAVSPQRLPPSVLPLLGLAEVKKEDKKEEKKDKDKEKQDKDEKAASEKTGSEDKTATTEMTPEQKTAEEGSMSSSQEPAAAGGEMPEEDAGMTGEEPAAGGTMTGEEAQATGDEAATSFEDVLTGIEATPDAAVDLFNEYLEQMDQKIDAGEDIGNLELVDRNTFEFAVPVGDGQTFSVTDPTDPSSVVTPAASQEAEAQTAITPDGLSTVEAEEAGQAVESSDGPESVLVTQEQSTLSEVQQIITESSTSQGGVPPSSSLVPPALPDRTGKSNLTNK